MIKKAFGICWGNAQWLRVLMLGPSLASSTWSGSIRPAVTPALGNFCTLTLSLRSLSLSLSLSFCLCLCLCLSLSLPFPSLFPSCYSWEWAACGGGGTLSSLSSPTLTAPASSLYRVAVLKGMQLWAELTTPQEQGQSQALENLFFGTLSF